MALKLQIWHFYRGFGILVTGKPGNTGKKKREKKRSGATEEGGDKRQDVTRISPEEHINPRRGEGALLPSLKGGAGQTGIPGEEEQFCSPLLRPFFMGNSHVLLEIGFCFLAFFPSFVFPTRPLFFWGGIVVVGWVPSWIFQSVGLFDMLGRRRRDSSTEEIFFFFFFQIPSLPIPPSSISGRTEEAVARLTDCQSQNTHTTLCFPNLDRDFSSRTKKKPLKRCFDEMFSQVWSSVKKSWPPPPPPPPSSSLLLFLFHT